MILVDILALILIGFVLLLLMAAVSSLESLLWWAGWERRTADYPSAALPGSGLDPDCGGESEPDSYIVYLSGAGQIAVGCAPLLRRALGRPAWIVSIGSILTDDPGILEVEHLYHPLGNRDHTQHIGRVVYSGCWPIFPYSAAHRAVRQGKITVIDVGPMKHMGQGDHMSRSALLPDGRRYVDKTVEVLATVLEEIRARAYQPC